MVAKRLPALRCPRRYTRARRKLAVRKASVAIYGATMANITRRDFINGSAVTIAGSMAGGLPRLALGNGGSHYPPALTGLRGSHPGSNTVAHQRTWNPAGQAPALKNTGEHYDLVIVGAGLSGLADAG